MSAAEREPLPATPVQEQMWLVDEMDPRAAVYNEHLALDLHGEVHPKALAAAFTRLVERHTALRTVLPVRGGRLHQELADPWQVDLTAPDHYTDLSAAPREERLAEARRWATRLVEEAYSLTTRPPVRVALARCGEERHLLVLGFHHAVMDAGAAAQLLTELGALYAAETGGEAAGPPPVRVDYRDFTRWHGQLLDSGRLDAERDAWVAELQGAPHVLEMPEDRQRPATKATTGALAVHAFPAGIVPRLRAFSAEHRVTPFHTLLAAFAAVVHRHSGADDMLLGICGDGRPEGYEDAVGAFSCMIPVRMRVPGDLPFDELLSAARETTLTAYDRQFIPFRQVVQESLERRDAARTPLVQVVFNAPPVFFEEDTLPGLRMTPVEIPRTRCRFDLLFNLEWRGDDIVATVEYDSGIYEPGTVERLVAHFASAVVSGLADPGLPVDALVLADPEAPRAAAVPEYAGGTLAAQIGPHVAPAPGEELRVLADSTGSPRLAAALGARPSDPGEAGGSGTPDGAGQAPPGALTLWTGPAPGAGAAPGEGRVHHVLPFEAGALVLRGDGEVVALPAATELREPSGWPAPDGVEGRLLVDGVEAGAGCGLRLRVLHDGRARWRLRTTRHVGERDGTVRSPAVERYLVELVGALLEDDGITAEDDFFAVGGHSMLAARMVQYLSDSFGVDVPLLLVFENPELDGLAAAIAARYPEVATALAEMETFTDEEVAARADGAGPEADQEAGRALGAEEAARETGLGAAEEPFWLMEQFAPGSPVNTLTLALRIEGPLDLSALTWALQQAVAREEILRTTYHLDEAAGEPRRRVATEARFALDVRDLRGPDAEDALARLAAECAERGFDVARLPLIRVTVARIGDEAHELLVTCHHLVMDYWAVTKVLFPQVAAAYRWRTTGEGALAEPPAVTFRQVVAEERRRGGSPAAQAQLRYWQRRLDGMEPLALPTDRHRPATPSFDGDVVYRLVPTELREALDAFVTRERVTPFVVLATALAAVLREWSGCDDVQLLTPSENRLDLERADVMGAFVNLLVLRYADPGAARTWRGLLAMTREIVAGAYAHQSLPAAEALASAGAGSLVGSGAGSYVTLNVFQADAGLTLAGCTVGHGRIVAHSRASTDLEISTLIVEDGLLFDIKYRTALWDRGSVEAFAARLEGALRALVERPEESPQAPGQGLR